MTFQESFLHGSFTAPLALGAGMVLTLFGVGFALWGVWVTRQRTAPRFLRTGWQQHLTLALGDVTPEQRNVDGIRSAQQQWIRLQGLRTVGIGAGTLLGVAGAFTLVLALVRVPFGLPPIGLETLLFVPWYLGAFAGYALSDRLSVQRYHRAGADDALTSGEPSRRVSDYRSPLLVLIVAVPFLVYSSVALILAPQYVAFTPDTIREYGIVPPPRWILAVYPCALLLMVVFAEVWVWLIAKSPASIRLRDAALAQRFNVGIIRQRMSFIYFLTLIFSAQLVQGGLQLFTLTGHADESSEWRLWVWLPLFLFCSAIGLSIQFTLGRMGGRLTGGPWSDGAARDDDGAAAAGGDGVV